LEASTYTATTLVTQTSIPTDQAARPESIVDHTFSEIVAVVAITLTTKTSTSETANRDIPEEPRPLGMPPLGAPTSESYLISVNTTEAD
jgi:hypothetical protein